MDGRTEGVGVAEVTAAVGHAWRWGRSVFVVALCVLAALFFDWFMKLLVAWVLAVVPALVARVLGHPPPTTLSLQGLTSASATFAILMPMGGALLGGSLAFVFTMDRAPWLHAATVGALLALLAALELAHRGASTAATQAWIGAAVIGMKLIGALAGGAFAAWLMGGSGEREDVGE